MKWFRDYNMLTLLLFFLLPFHSPLCRRYCDTKLNGNSLVVTNIQTVSYLNVQFTLQKQTTENYLHNPLFTSTGTSSNYTLLHKQR